MSRDRFSCQRCGDTETTLNVHHRRYKNGVALWQYEDVDLVTLCEPCHECIHGLRSQGGKGPTLLADLLPQLIPDSMHDFYHLIGGQWLCFCGCGETQSREQFNPKEKICHP